MEHTLYEQLFDIASENMQQSGNTFTHPKAAFLYYTENHPFETDLLQLMQIKAANEEFIEIAYIAILNRPIDEEAKEKWARCFLLPQKSFRKQVIHELTNSPEAKLCHKRVYHHAELMEQEKMPQNSGSLMQKLLPLYRRLPKGLKSRIRRIMGVDEE